MGAQRGTTSSLGRWECRRSVPSHPELPGAARCAPPEEAQQASRLLGHTQPKVWGGYFDPMLRCDCRKRGSSAACGRSGAGVGRRCPRAGRGWSCAWLCGLDSLCGACGGSSLIRLSRISRLCGRSRSVTTINRKLSDDKIALTDQLESHRGHTLLSKSLGHLIHKIDKRWKCRCLRAARVRYYRVHIHYVPLQTKLSTPARV